MSDSDNNNNNNSNSTNTNERDGQLIDVTTQTDLTLNPLAFHIVYNPEMRVERDAFYLSWVMSYPSIQNSTPPPLYPLAPVRPQMRTERRTRGVRRPAAPRRNRRNVNLNDLPATFNPLFGIPSTSVAASTADIAGPSAPSSISDLFNISESSSVRLPSFDTIRPPSNTGTLASQFDPWAGFARPSYEIAGPSTNNNYRIIDYDGDELVIDCDCEHCRRGN